MTHTTDSILTPHASTSTSAGRSTPAGRTGPFQRVQALGKAEVLQFLRNRTILFTAVVFPLTLPLAVFLIEKSAAGRGNAALAAEMFALFALMFVVFYSVLSMATTRRDEKVLKRLRTGEATNSEILTAITVPGALLSLLTLAVFFPLFFAVGAERGVILFPFVVTFVIGIFMSAALAFITSAATKNAEAAQLTSMPVIMLAMLSLSSVRALLPESIARFADWTPFALIGDITALSWSGNTMRDKLAGAAPLDAGQVLIESLPLAGALVAWTILLWALVPRVMKWETNR